MNSLSDCLHCNEYNKVVSKATATENGLTFELLNKSGFSIAKWRIDDCILKAEDGSKCDFLFVVEEKFTCYWVELKDEGFDDACLQIHSTIKKIAEAGIFKTQYAIIVLGRFTESRNRIDTIRYTNYKKLINVIGGKDQVKYKTKILTVEI